MEKINMKEFFRLWTFGQVKFLKNGQNLSKKKIENLYRLGSKIHSQSFTLLWHLERGQDGTGNIYNENNYNYLNKKFSKKFEIITGDGGIDFSLDYNDQENMAIRLILTQCIYALTMQKKGGKFTSGDDYQVTNF